MRARSIGGWRAARIRAAVRAARSASRTSRRSPALRTTFGSPLYADYVPDEDALVVQPAARGRRHHPRQDQLSRVRRRRQHVQRGVRPHAQSVGPDEERRRIDRRRRRGARHRHDRARRRHRPRRLAAHSRVVLRPGRAAPVGRPGADLADRLGVGHAAGDRADGAHRRGCRADAAGDRRADASWSPMRQPVAGRDFVAAVAGRRARGAARRVLCRPGRHRHRRRPSSGVPRGGVLGFAMRASRSKRSSSISLPAAQAFLALRGLWFVTHMAPRMRQGGPVRHRTSPTTCAPAWRRRRRELAAAEQERGRIWHQFRELFDAVRSLAHAVHGGAAVPGRAELSGHDRRPADADLHRLDRADVRAEPHRPAGGVGAVRARRAAGCRWDCRSSAGHRARRPCWRLRPRFSVAAQLPPLSLV